jgi:hypothetical protein
MTKAPTPLLTSYFVNALIAEAEIDKNIVGTCQKKKTLLEFMLQWEVEPA